MSAKRLLFGIAVGTSGFLAPACAETWDFTAPTGVTTSPHGYVGSAGTTITATAFGPNAPSLFGKNEPGDEVGLGETNDAAGNDEITSGSFIQLSLSAINFGANSADMSFQAASTTDGEAWQVYGSNTAGSLGTLLDSCTSAGGPGNACENVVTVNGLGNFQFADVTASSGGILLQKVDTSPIAVPAPVVGAGFPGLVAAIGGLIGLRRRRISCLARRGLPPIQS